MIARQELESYLLEFANTWLEFPFDGKLSAYRVGDKASGKGQLFALVDPDSDPLRISLRCDPQLALTLRAKYESVLPGQNLSKKHWNTIICTGQLSNDEIKDLARLSYNLVAANLSAE